MRNLQLTSEILVKRCMLIFLLSMTIQAEAQFTCCPKFKINFPDICSDSTACRSSTPNREPIKACKGAATKYTVLPALGGYTYSWTVVGGTPATPTGNPMVITWGTGSSGYIKVVITGPGGLCKDSIMQEFCMVDAPNAGFTAPDSVCLGMPVSFTNTSVGGNVYSWDFGDGSTYNGTNNTLTHTYAAAGTYIVCLTVTNSTGQGSAGGNKCIGCSDFFCDTILVKAGTGPDINLVGCKGSFCASAGDTTRFSTSSTCTPLTWSIPAGAGTILNPGGNPVQIIWNPAFLGTPSVTLTVPLTCSGGCPASTTIIAPVIFPNLPVSGPNPVCVNSVNTHSIPVLPGSYYSVSLTNLGAMASIPFGTNTFNTNTIDINSGPIPGQYIIQFTYYDSLKKCGGVAKDTIDVKNRFKIFAPPGPICDNTPTTICANGSANWTIDSAGITIATFSSLNCISILALNPGVHTISATPVNPLLFCNSSDLTIINILPNPVLTTLNALNDTVCPGTLMVYNVSSTVPSSPFTWNITGAGNTIMANEDSIVTVKWMKPGTLTVNQQTPCLSNTLTFTVDTFLAPSITGPMTACEDDIVTYTVTPAGLPSYNFTPLYGSIVSQTANTVTVMWAGNTSGGHSLSVTTCSGTSSINVAVTSAAPTSVNLVSYGCNNAIISSSIAGASPYAWYLNGVLQPLLTTQTVTVTSNGYWSCKPTGCYKRGGFNVAIPAPPALNITTPLNRFCGALPIINFYSALSMGTGVTYQWYGPASNNAAPTAIGGATSSIFTTSTTFIGNYYLVVTYGAGCTVTSNTLNIDTACGSGGGGGCTPPSYALTNLTSSCVGSGKTFTVTTSTAPPVGTTYAWSYGDGNTGSGNPSSHTYTLPGVYNVCVTVTSPGFCSQVRCKLDTVTFVPNFRIKQVCTGDSLFNTTQLLAGHSISSFSWTAGAGTSLTSTTSNPTFATGNGNITLTVTVGGCTNTITQAITTPSSAVTIIGVPVRACKGSMVSGITTSPAPSNFSVFTWTWGDGTTSNMAPTQHAWNTTLGSPFTIKLVTINNLGCKDSNTTTIIIDTLPVVKLSNDTSICKGGFVNLSASPTSLSSYLWFNADNTSLGPPNINPRPFSNTGQYYVRGTDGNGCSSNSNIVTVVVKPLPKIKFTFNQGQTVCLFGGAGGVSAASIANSNYLYSWTSDDPTNISFFSANSNPTYISVASGASLGFHQIYLTVLDTSTGCSKSDTVCIYLQNSPTVTIAPGGPICEGNIVTLTPTPNNPLLYNYVWSTGATTPTISVSSPGTYSVTIDSMGCSSSSNFVTINPKPNLELYPRGCDTMCDTAHLYIPLANTLGFPPNPSQYPSIVWLVDGVITIPGSYLYMSSISLGSHNIQVIVTNNFGCKDTSGIYTVFVKKCDSICPPCIKDSCCNDFLDSMKNKTIGVNYATSPILVFTPPAGLLASDVVQWDFDCDGIVDMTTMGMATASWNYFTSGTYYACINVMRFIHTATQKDTCYVKFTKKVIVERKQSDNPCEYCHNLFVNVNIKDDCAIAGDRTRTAFATGGSGLYTYRWYNLAGVLQFVGINYAGASPCYCIVTDNVTGCRDTSGTDWYNDIFGCVPNTVADARCTNFKLVITKVDGVGTGDVILTAYGANGSGNYNFFWYGYSGLGGSPINSGGFVPGPTSLTTPVLTSGPLAMYMKVKDLNWGCEALDSFHLIDKRCNPSSIQSILKDDIKVYPNPTSGSLLISANSSIQLNNTEIEIIDILGRSMDKIHWKTSLDDINIDMDKYPAGIYHLRILDESNEIVFYDRVVKK